jgi:hypothetical protein
MMEDNGEKNKILITGFWNKNVNDMWKEFVDVSYGNI